ncbi:MAG: efflux RND transporter permease subunit [Sulfurimonas sp.]
MYRLAIDRPITTLMYIVTLMIFGFISFRTMPADLFPNVDFPIVTVKTAYPGAEPTTVESEVTDKIEEAVSQIEGIETIISNSADGVSMVTIKFLLERKIDEAANDVRDKVSAIKLPTEAKLPLINKLDIGAAPIVSIFLTAKNDSVQNLMMFADEQIKPLLQKVKDVGAINIIGYRDREIKIYPELNELSKNNITITELNQIVANENLKLGGGKLITNTNEFILKTVADALSVDELKDIKIKDGLRLRDVARVEDGLEDASSYSSYNGVEGVMLEVQKISGTNALDIISDVKKVVPQIERLAGDRFGVKVLNDTSEFILKSLHDVEFDLIYGAILASIIVFVFLRNLTITIVSALTIPASILGTFALMSYMGYNLNKMTLIGLTLAIGIIIDDAIVVIENIYKKIEGGMSAQEASMQGAKEMAFAILAISAMLLAVFIPVSFMSGIVGKFFESFAMTVGFAIIISYTIVLTFIPSLSARVLSKSKSWFYEASEFLFVALDNFYVKLLRVSLRFKFIVFLVAIATLVFSLKLFPSIGLDFMPKEDKGEFEVKIKVKAGVSLEHMIKESKVIEEVVKSTPNIEYTTLNVAYTATREKHKASIYVKLADKNHRDKNQEQIIHELRAKLKEFNTKDMLVSASAIPNIKGAGVSVPYQIVLKSDSFEKLSDAKNNLIAHLEKKEGFVDIDTDLDDNKPQYNVKILRQNAANLGISASSIAQAIFIAYSSDLEISYFEDKAKQYNITLRVADKDRVSLDDIKKLQVRTSSGELVYLDGLVEFESSSALATINRFDRQREVTVFADIFNLPLGEAVAYTEASIDEILPDGVSYRFTGFAEEMQKTAKAFGGAIGLSVVLMFIILAILYESLVQPIIIMVTLPLSIIGVMLSLYMSGMQFSLFVMIGFMLLMGMVGKNAVLLIDFANQAIKDGGDIDSSLIEAGEKRLRPILMTTIAMIFAMVPLAFGGGIGSETKAPMAISVIGGLISSMVLTLFVVPALYKIIYPLDRWLKRFYVLK